jgi:hypothetical protein
MLVLLSLVDKSILRSNLTLASTNFLVINCKIFGNLPLKPWDIYLFVGRPLELETDRMSNKLLHIESAARHKHHIQMKMEYCYTGKES